jgi:hypothetical protein
MAPSYADSTVTGGGDRRPRQTDWDQAGKLYRGYERSEGVADIVATLS